MAGGAGVVGGLPHRRRRRRERRPGQRQKTRTAPRNGCGPSGILRPRDLLTPDVASPGTRATPAPWDAANTSRIHVWPPAVRCAARRDDSTVRLRRRSTRRPSPPEGGLRTNPAKACWPAKAASPCSRNPAACHQPAARPAEPAHGGTLARGRPKTRGISDEAGLQTTRPGGTAAAAVRTAADGSHWSLHARRPADPDADDDGSALPPDGSRASVVSLTSARDVYYSID